MSLPPIPTPLEHFGNRPFSFYPPILNIESNEWFYRRGTWSEILVVNTRANLEIWIPRRFLGEISRIEDPVVIVGLVKELEYKAGAVWPHQRRVIEMPVAVGDSRHVPAQIGAPAPVIGIRPQSVTDSRVGRLVGITMLVGVGVTVSLIAINIFRESALRPQFIYHANNDSYLQLTRDDDYYAVARKLGTPSEDRWQSEDGEIQFRSLGYPQNSYTVVLMGDTRNNARYIGTVDEHWNPIHWIALRAGGSTRATLKGLKRF